jgi:hypothetical protein
LSTRKISRTKPRKFLYLVVGEHVDYCRDDLGVGAVVTVA